MNPLAVIFGLLVVLSAGVTQGLSSFGFALITVPIMTVFLSPKTVVPILLIHSALINTVVLLNTRKWVDLKRIWPLMIAGIVGIPFGTYLLIVIGASMLKIFIGLVVSLCAVALWRNARMRIKSEKLASVPVGLMSGAVGTPTAITGPPVVLLFANQGMAKQGFRANLAAYFLVLNLATIPAFLLGGLITVEVVYYAILFIPATLLGAVIGLKLAHRVREQLFRKFVLTIVVIMGLVSVASGLGLL
jgi:uncharacterized membrane protein YfcA